jgi:hypothetical protein
MTNVNRLTFTKADRPAGRKTDVFTVRNGDEPLGSIAWFSPWRRFVFFPVANTLFDASCLTEITSYITDLMLLRTPGKKYNPAFGDEKLCARAGCGHEYYRHFDWADDYRPNCKYCPCEMFVP